jgi:hypothetical protein
VAPSVALARIVNALPGSWDGLVIWARSEGLEPPTF